MQTFAQHLEELIAAESVDPDAARAALAVLPAPPAGRRRNSGRRAS
jgi:hypothetical protein